MYRSRTKQNRQKVLVYLKTEKQYNFSPFLADTALFRWNLVCVDSHVTQITRTAYHHQQQSISEAAILPMSQISTPQIATRESKVQVSYGTILHEEEEQPKRNM